MTTKRQWQHRFSSTTVNKRNVKCETRLYIISTDVFEQRLMHMIKTWDDNKFGRETNFAKIYTRIWPKFTKIFDNVNFGEDFRKISILITIFENLDYCQFFWKISIWSNFRKFPIYVKLSKNLNYGQNCRKIAILVEIGENFKIFDKSRFYSKHYDFGRNSRKSRFWSQFFKYLEWSKDFRNISILIKISEISQFLAKI